MNRIELHRRLDRLLDRLQDIETAMRLLVHEYRRRFAHERLSLYLVEDRKRGQCYGPYWAKLRKVKMRRGGREAVVTIKRYYGTRLTRKQMYLCGVINLKPASRASPNSE